MASDGAHSSEVRPLDLGVQWDGNVAFPVFLAGDQGKAELWLNAHSDDADQSWVVLHWVNFVAAKVLPFGDETLEFHPFYDRGVSEIVWAGEFNQSDWLDEIRRAVFPGMRASLRHLIVAMKEATIEVVAAEVHIERSADPPANGWLHRRLY